MRLSEFVLTRTLGDGPLNWQYVAEVSVTTGWLWWRTTTRRTILRRLADYWHFVDTGQFCPGFQAEELERSYKAQEALRG